MACPEPCVVDAAPIVELVRGFVADWNATRPPEPPEGNRRPSSTSPERGTAVPLLFFGAVVWLAQETGIPKSTIQKISQGRMRVVGLSVADRIAQALDRPELLWDGTLVVQPNPQARLEVHADRQQIVLGGDVVASVTLTQTGTYRAFMRGSVLGEAATLESLTAAVSPAVRRATCCSGSAA